MLGKKSGLDSIRIKADELGLEVPDERRAPLLSAVKQLGMKKRGLVTDDEFRALVDDTPMNSERGLYDVVVVGSGVNGLTCAALLARAGRRVCVLERNDWFGGAIKTAEITQPGFHHDVFSAWHPLWVGGAAHARLGDDLARHGLEYVNTDHPTATLFPDGEAAFLLRTADANAAELDRHERGDGDAWRSMLEDFFPNADLAFDVLGTELWSRHGAGSPCAPTGRLGRRGTAEFTGRLLHVGSRLAGRIVHVTARARPACSLGAPYGPRA